MSKTADSEINIEQQRAEWVRYYWLNGGNLRLDAVTVERDKRKQAKTVRAYLDAGVIVRVSEDAGHGAVYRLTPAATDSVAAERPDLVVLGKVAEAREMDLSNLRGVGVGTLPISAIRFIVEHPDQYRIVDEWNRPTTMASFREAGRRGVVVRDIAYVNAVRDRRHKARVIESARKNMAWGLVSAGMVEEVDEDCFRVRDSQAAHIGFGEDSPGSFSADPDQWENDVPRVLEELRERISKLTRKANGILRADRSIREHGGWQKFVADYRERIEQAVTDEEAEEAAKAKVEAEAAKKGAAS